MAYVDDVPHLISKLDESWVSSFVHCMFTRRELRFLLKNEPVQCRAHFLWKLL